MRWPSLIDPNNPALPPDLFQAPEAYCLSADAGCNIKGNISIATDEYIYHVPGQEHYRETIIRPEFLSDGSVARPKLGRLGGEKRGDEVHCIAALSTTVAKLMRPKEPSESFLFFAPTIVRRFNHLASSVRGQAMLLTRAVDSGHERTGSFAPQIISWLVEVAAALIGQLSLCLIRYGRTRCGGFVWFDEVFGKAYLFEGRAYVDLCTTGIQR